MPTLTQRGMNYSNTEAAVALQALQSRQHEILHIAKETAKAVKDTIEHKKTCTKKDCKPVMVMVEPNLMQCLLAVVPLALQVAKEDGNEEMMKAMTLHVKVN